VHFFNCTQHHPNNQGVVNIDFQIEYEELAKLLRSGSKTALRPILPLIRAAFEVALNDERDKTGIRQIYRDAVFSNTTLNFSIVTDIPSLAVQHEVDRVWGIANRLERSGASVKVTSAFVGGNGHSGFRIEHDCINNRYCWAGMYMDDTAWDLLDDVKFAQPDFWGLSQALMSFFRHVNATTSMSFFDIAKRTDTALRIAVQLHAANLYEDNWFQGILATMTPDDVLDFKVMWCALGTIHHVLFESDEVVEVDGKKKNVMKGAEEIGIDLEQAKLEFAFPKSKAPTQHEKKAKVHKI